MTLAVCLSVRLFFLVSSFLSACACACLSVCLFVCGSVCLPACLPACPSPCLCPDRPVTSFCQCSRSVLEIRRTIVTEIRIKLGGRCRLSVSLFACLFCSACLLLVCPSVRLFFCRLYSYHWHRPLVQDETIFLASFRVLSACNSGTSSVWSSSGRCNFCRRSRGTDRHFFVKCPHCTVSS